VCSRHVDVSINTLRDDGFFEFAFSVELEQITGAKGEGHTFIVFLQMIVYFCQYQGCQLSFREAFIFVESFTEGASQHRSSMEARPNDQDLKRS